MPSMLPERTVYGRRINPLYLPQTNAPLHVSHPSSPMAPVQSDISVTLPVPVPMSDPAQPPSSGSPQPPSSGSPQPPSSGSPQPPSSGSPQPPSSNPAAPGIDQQEALRLSAALPYMEEDLPLCTLLHYTPYQIMNYMVKIDLPGSPHQTFSTAKFHRMKVIIILASILRYITTFWFALDGLVMMAWAIAGHHVLKAVHFELLVIPVAIICGITLAVRWRPRQVLELPQSLILILVMLLCGVVLGVKLTSYYENFVVVVSLSYPIAVSLAWSILNYATLTAFQGYTLFGLATVLYGLYVAGAFLIGIEFKTAAAVVTVLWIYLMIVAHNLRSLAAGRFDALNLKCFHMSNLILAVIVPG